MPWFELLLTENGTLQMTQETAARFFPADALAVTNMAQALMLWTLCGHDPGGLVLKQCSAAGARSVLIAEHLPENWQPGTKLAAWDGAQMVATLPFAELRRLRTDRSQRAVGVRAIVSEERGRWVVHLEVAHWQPEARAGDMPIEVKLLRISDHATEARAKIAAHWIEGTAERVPDPRWMGAL